MTAGSAFTLFDTDLGRCAIVWRANKVIGFLLPGSSEGATRSRVMRAFAAAELPPPGFVADAIAAVRRHLGGEPADLSFIPVAFPEASDFERAVYEAARAIPTGETRTYGELADTLGTPGAARAIGRALGRNPVPVIIPCHRILAAAGKSGGFSAPGGVTTKFRILELEGARRGREPELFEHLPWAGKPAS